MIRLSVFYPSSEGTTFDHDYYRDKHVPLAVSIWNPVRAEIDRGINGPNMAAVHFFFDSMQAMQAAMANPDTKKLADDLPNYTNGSSVLQISEVVGQS